eukprot:1670908-Prymnesium_polylepis.1
MPGGDVGAQMPGGDVGAQMSGGDVGAQMLAATWAKPRSPCGSSRVSRCSELVVVRCVLRRGGAAAAGAS